MTIKGNTNNSCSNSSKDHKVNINNKFKITRDSSNKTNSQWIWNKITSRLVKATQTSKINKIKIDLF